MRNKKLNKMEWAILSEIINENKNKYPFLEEHLQLLYVKNRENTIVGIYVTFGYKKDIKENGLELFLSSKKILKIKELKNEVTYELNISNGKFDFLEIVTNGNDRFVKEKFDYDFIFK